MNIFTLTKVIQDFLKATARTYDTGQIIVCLTGLTRETVNIVLNTPECLMYARSNSRQRFEINKDKIAAIVN